jgi:hypothetical protein
MNNTILVAAVLVLALGFTTACPGSNLRANAAVDLSDVHRRLKVKAGKVGTTQSTTTLVNKKINKGSAVATSSSPANVLGTCLASKQDCTAETVCSAYGTVLSLVENYLSGLNEIESSAFKGIALRLAFHDAGEYENGAGGPDACLSHTADNTGLFELDSLVATVIAPMWHGVCDRIGAADFIAMLSKVLVESSLTASPDELFVFPSESLSDIHMNIPFHFGRVDNSVCEVSESLLPDAMLGFKTFESLFVDRLGLTLEQGVALLGGHTFGHVHKHVSGFALDETSHWAPDMIDPSKDARINAFDSTPANFDNAYWKMSFQEEWFSRAQVEKPNLVHWEFGYFPSVILHSGDLVSLLVLFEKTFYLTFLLLHRYEHAVEHRSLQWRDC